MSRRGPRRPGECTAAVLLVAGLLIALVSGRRETVAWPAGRTIDPNVASAAELALLPGIGPRLAEAMVVERETGGPFASIDDLERTPRIGPAVVSRIASYVRITRRPPTEPGVQWPRPEQDGQPPDP